MNRRIVGLCVFLTGLLGFGAAIADLACDHTCGIIMCEEDESAPYYTWSATEPMEWTPANPHGSTAMGYCHVSISDGRAVTIIVVGIVQGTATPLFTHYAGTFCPYMA